ncbi:hypothetical protein GCM10010106_41460 [Thermopolyspora flexuosa]|uniref:DUF7455 domain-containing protein n=1 Tax=Thermopolyspora flexuosa TaxID=103836 RepID=A0A543IUK4_9ACTN|nr:hypothetical protein [Thermopolyspora flexuosa]TQM74252.1 hypothetical protein FHX40_0920 [Thermopolyspora flexuosa]GGM89728.1 hypothetical protein GCM10010106_41460 [Thermopolyspora flexuosa]
MGAPDPSPEITAYAHARRMALARADRSCCCPAKPVVMTIMPMASAQGEPIELFLCGHHYRVSRRRLAEIGAVVFDGDGLPLPVDPWPVEVGAFA